MAKKYFWAGVGELKIKVTYKNNPYYEKVLSSPNGCFIDHYNSEIRVVYGRPYKVVEQGELQQIEVKVREVSN